MNIVLDLEIFLSIFGSVIVAWVLINLKRGRREGKLIKNVHPYRTMLLHACPNRQSATDYFDLKVRAKNLEAFIKKNEGRVNVMNVLVWASKLSFESEPKMNSFCSGKRLYRRNGIHVSFTVKKNMKNKSSEVSLLKMNLSKIN